MFFFFEQNLFVACYSSFQQKRETKAWLTSAPRGQASGEWVHINLLRGATGQQEQGECCQLWFRFGERGKRTHNWQMNVFCQFLNFLTSLLKESTSWELRKIKLPRGGRLYCSFLLNVVLGSGNTLKHGWINMVVVQGPSERTPSNLPGH